MQIQQVNYFTEVEYEKKKQFLYVFYSFKQFIFDKVKKSKLNILSYMV